MDALFTQIERANEAGLHYVALIATTLIPDMCVALGHGETKGRLYRKWFDNEMGPRMIDANEATRYADVMTGDDCWGLRCSLAHQGRLVPHQGGFTRMMFVAPNDYTRAVAQLGGTVPLHGGIAGYQSGEVVLILDIVTFCNDMISAAKRWLTTVQDTPAFKANFAKFMRLHPEGAGPVARLPVIV